MPKLRTNRSTLVPAIVGGVVFLALLVLGLLLWKSDDQDADLGNTVLVPGKGYGPSTQSPELLDADTRKMIDEQPVRKKSP